MTFSFIVPVYNCKDYLPACVDSIRAVGAEDYEILLIDDGSADGSGALCDELADKFPEVRTVHQENAGASAARNRGIGEARGAYLLFLDADDSIDADVLGRILEDPRVRETDLTVFGMTFDYYHRGGCYRRDPLCFDFDGVLDRKSWGEAFRQLFRDNALSPVWNKIYKREILLKNRLQLNPSLFVYEDLEFVLRYMAHCGKLWNVPRAVYHYRQSEDEGNAGRRLKRIDNIPEYLRFLESALRNLPDAVSEQDKAAVLQQLHLVLAREKIAVSDLRTIQQLCRDYRSWSENRLLPLERGRFQQLLLEGSASQLYLRNKKTQLRHWIAVRVKALIRGKKNEH